MPNEDPHGSATNLFEEEPAVAGTTYGDFRMVISYNHSDGLVQLPVARDDDDKRTECSVVRCHDPVTTKVVHWTAERTGSPPEVPDPRSIDPDSVLLGFNFSPAAPVPTIGGVDKVWRITGTATYAMRNPLDLTKPIPTGVLPIDVSPSSDHDFPPDYFSPYLVGGTSQ